MKKSKFIIQPKIIIKDIIQLYICACFITSMIIFFSNGDVLSFEKITYSKSTWITFVVMMVFEFFYNIFFIPDYWFGDCEKVTVNEISEKATLEATLADAEPDTVKMYGKKVCAVHEAGHALIACLKDIEFTEVSLRGQTPHVTIKAYTTNGESFLNRIIMLYGGAAAEEILIGNFCLGSFGDNNSDFSRATNDIKNYIVMTDTRVSKTLLDAELATKMIGLSKELYSTAKEILNENKEILEIVVEKLLEKDTLSYEEIKELIAN